MALFLLNPRSPIADPVCNRPGVTVLLVNNDRAMRKIEDTISGRFLNQINHRVEGLFAWQIQERHFEGNDFQTSCDLLKIYLAATRDASRKISGIV